MACETIRRVTIATKRMVTKFSPVTRPKEKKKGDLDDEKKN